MDRLPVFFKLNLMHKQLTRDILHTYNSLSDDEKNKLKDSCILITGAGGFLGYYFLHFFKETAAELGIKQIIALDNYMLGKPAWIHSFDDDNRFIIKQFNIINDDIAAIANGPATAGSANFVIHLASIASPVFYRKFPLETVDANIWGLRRLLDFYKEKNIQGLLFFSSSEIYGNPGSKAVPTNEEYYGYVSATGPRSCYDESKRFGETLCMLFAGQYGMPIGVTRPFNNYGPGMRLNDKRVPADFALAVREGRDISILSDGSPTRTFCYVADAIAGYLKILLHGRYDYFNIGIENPEITIRDLAEYYVKAGQNIFGYKGSVIFAASEDKQYLVNNPQRRCPDISKARQILGYNPTIPVDEGIHRFLRFIKESPKENYFW
jgi:UDP-glucuronate decarboxylase